jgi:hypothetical protein
MSAAALRKPAPFVELYVAAERIILIRGTHWNLNLRELHDAICGAPVPGVRVRFVLARDGRILSKRADLPAVDTGYWPEDRA